MALMTSLLFAGGFIVAAWSIIATLLPARDRIRRLLKSGPEWTIDPLPPVRLTSRRGIIRDGSAVPVIQTRRAAA